MTGGHESRTGPTDCELITFLVGLLENVVRRLYVGKKGSEKLVFDRAYIEITRRCTRSCAFCPSVGEDAVMPVEMFRQVITEAVPLAGQVFLHVLGEPLLHPELGALLEICREAGMPVNLTTNGDRIGDYEALDILNPIVRQINFSFHALSEHDDTLEAILEFAREAGKRRPDLYLNFRFWNDDADNSALLARIGEGLGIETPAPPQKSRRSLRICGRVYLNFDRRFVWPELHHELVDERGTCHGLESQFAVLCDGRVTICCLDQAGAETLGRIGEAPLAQILSGPAAERIRNGWRERKAVAELCRRCSFRKRFIK